MSHQSCARCRKQERIPTHQFVKFDTEIQYLCGGCWAGFRRFFYARERIETIDTIDAAEPRNVERADGRSDEPPSRRVA